MSMISELIKDLKRVKQHIDPLEKDMFVCSTVESMKIIDAAIDTIEVLFAKLSAKNMERSERYYKGGWILCKDRLPSKEECGDYGEETFLVTVFANELKTLVMRYEYTKIRGKEVGRWLWCDRVNVPWEIIAWQPLPQPYQGE